MTTAPVLTPLSELKAIEKRIGVFFDPTHIILAVCLFSAIFAGVYLYQGRRVAQADGEKAVATAIAAQLKEDAAASKQANERLQAQKDAAIAILTSANASLTLANQKLTDAMNAESLALANQQKADKALPPTEQASRWQTLVPHATVHATPTGFSIDAQGGLDTLLQLESVPVYITQLAQAKGLLDNASKTITNDAQILADEKDKHAADLKNDAAQLAAAKGETKKVQSDFDDYKQHARRNYLRVYVAGVATGLAIKHILGF